MEEQPSASSDLQATRSFERALLSFAVETENSPLSVRSVLLLKKAVENHSFPSSLPVTGYRIKQLLALNKSYIIYNNQGLYDDEMQAQLSQRIRQLLTVLSGINFVYFIHKGHKGYCVYTILF